MKTTKTTLILLFMMAMSAIGFGQCPPTFVTGFTSQAEVDAFPIDYPNCTELSYVSIQGSDIVDLTPLQQLTTISSQLVIRYNTALTSLTGLDNITSIGSNLTIGPRNHELTDLTGLDNVTSIAGGMTISDNDGLINLAGLDNLTSIGDWISIVVNDNLESLSGLENLTSINGDFEIHRNFSLANIDGLANIDYTGIYSLRIYENSELSICHIKSVCDYLRYSTGYTLIRDNKVGCESRPVVENQCSTPPLCTSISDPLDGQSNVDITTDLSWDASTDATGYKLIVGTTSGGTDILDNVDVGNVTTYDPGDFPCDATIYVSIVPYNASGDATGCIEESFETEYVIADAGPDEEICDGESVDLSASGGTTYAWLPIDGLDDPNIANPTASPNTTTSYTVSVCNDNGCCDTDELIITVNPAPILSATNKDLLCFGDSDGEIDLMVSGGSAPYTYSWDNGATSEDLTELSAGDYCVTVTDVNGCQSMDCWTINEPPRLSGAASYSSTVTCHGANDASININGFGGTPGYTYLWDDGSTDQSRTDLFAGVYCYTISDANACTLSRCITIDEPDELVLTADSQDVLCFGDSNGEIDLSVSGGTLGYTYLWDNGETSEDLSGLSQGTYCATVTDRYNCEKSDCWTINEPDELLASFTRRTRVSCFGGSDAYIRTNARGGTPAYTYLWDDGNTDKDRTDLPAGDYCVTITDANACTFDYCINIGEPAPLSLSGASIDVLCFGGNDGEIDITVGGGTPSAIDGSYDYSWSNGETTEDLTGLSAGDYCVTVTDVAGCEINDCWTIDEPDELRSGQTYNTRVSCYGGSDGIIRTNPTGGTPPYTYLWDDGSTDKNRVNVPAGDYCVTISDANSCSFDYCITLDEPAPLSLPGVTKDVLCFGGNDGEIDITVGGGTPSYSFAWDNGSANEDQTGLTAGKYCVTVTDINGCEISDCWTINEPPQLTLSGTATDILCFGSADGEIDITVGGGTPPYSYSWDNGSSTQDQTGLTAGTYCVTVTDNNGCTIQDCWTINEPPEIIINADVSNVSCFGADNGFIDLTVAGGTPGYAYNWNTGDLSEDISGLLAGDYCVTVTDMNDCEKSQCFTIIEPDLLVANASSTNETGNGFEDGTATANPTGGTPPYTYLWSNGESTQTIENLYPQDYTVTVTDSRGCTAVETVTVEKFICPDLEMDYKLYDIKCAGECDGIITVNYVRNAVEPLEYLWSNGETWQSIQFLCAGDYIVTVTDRKNCSIVQHFTLTDPTAIDANAQGIDESAKDQDDGVAYCDPENGKAPYSYEWSTGESTQYIDGLEPGVYYLTLTDADNCSAYDTVLIKPFDCGHLELDNQITHPSCHGACDAIIEIRSAGGFTTPLEVEWEDGYFGQNRSGLCAGEYILKVTDYSYCTDYINIEIIEPEFLQGNVTVTNESASNSQDGAASAHPTGGTEPYTYLWSTGAVDSEISGLSIGTYELTVTDANGCTAIETVEVIEFSCPQLDVVERIVDASCYESCDGSIEITEITNGTAPFEYSWNTGNDADQENGVCAGQYSVVIKDANNCYVTKEFSVDQGEKINIELSDMFPIDENGEGSIDINLDENVDYEVEWYHNGMLVSTDEDLTEIINAGCYQLLVRDMTTLCEADTTICIPELSVSSSTQDLTEENLEWTIYPNPSNDFVFLNIESYDEQNISLKVVNINGQVIHPVISSEPGKITLDFRNYIEGIYLIQLLKNDNMSTKTIIINR